MKVEVDVYSCDSDSVRMTSVFSGSIDDFGIGSADADIGLVVIAVWVDAVVATVVAADCLDSGGCMTEPNNGLMFTE